MSREIRALQNRPAFLLRDEMEADQRVIGWMIETEYYFDSGCS